MMKKLWLFVVVIAIFMGFCGCEEEDPVGKYPDHGIAGKWKLVKMRVYTTNPDPDSGWSKTVTTDYSKENIIFDFQYQENLEDFQGPGTPKRKLVVSGYTQTNFPNELPQDGEYVYQFRLSSYGSASASGMPAPDRGNLLIENADSSFYFFVRSDDSDANRYYINKSTKTLSIGPGWVPPYETNGNTYFFNENGYSVTWTKHFVRVGDAEV